MYNIGLITRNEVAVIEQDMNLLGVRFFDVLQAQKRAPSYARSGTSTPRFDPIRSTAADTILDHDHLDGFDTRRMAYRIDRDIVATCTIYYRSTAVYRGERVHRIYHAVIGSVYTIQGHDRRLHEWRMIKMVCTMLRTEGIHTVYIHPPPLDGDPYKSYGFEPLQTSYAYICTYNDNGQDVSRDIPSASDVGVLTMENVPSLHQKMSTYVHTQLGSMIIDVSSVDANNTITSLAMSAGEMVYWLKNDILLRHQRRQHEDVTVGIALHDSFLLWLTELDVQSLSILAAHFTSLSSYRRLMACVKVVARRLGKTKITIREVCHQSFCAYDEEWKVLPEDRYVPMVFTNDDWCCMWSMNVTETPYPAWSTI